MKLSGTAWGTSSGKLIFRWPRLPDAFAPPGEKYRFTSGGVYFGKLVSEQGSFFFNFFSENEVSEKGGEGFSGYWEVAAAAGRG